MIAFVYDVRASGKEEGKGLIERNWLRRTS
jgi:hypothetical protein